MKVDRICTHRVIGTSRSSSLREAASMMRKFHVGSLVVMGDPPEESNAVGFVTDRDVVIHAVADGLDTRHLTMGDVMSPGVRSIRRDADLHEALQAMHMAGQRRLVVTDADDNVTGMLSIDDVIDGLAIDVNSLSGLVKAGLDREAEEEGGEIARA